MIQPGRNFNSSEYRFGFNGMESDDEISGVGNSYTAEFWQYDPRLGRRWNIDPLTWKYPWQSPYASFNNNPIYFIDPIGLEGDDPPKWGGTLKVAEITATRIHNSPASPSKKDQSLLSKAGDFFMKVGSAIASGLYAADRWAGGTYSYQQESGIHFYQESGGDNENAKASHDADVEMEDYGYLGVAIGGAGAGKFQFGQGSMAVAEGVSKSIELIQKTVKPTSPVLSKATYKSVENKQKTNARIIHYGGNFKEDYTGIQFYRDSTSAGIQYNKTVTNKIGSLIVPSSKEEYDKTKSIYEKN